MNNKSFEPLKKCLLVEDITCYGKCATTVALPIMSTMAIETSVLPTAILSTHPAGFGKNTNFDYTFEMPKIFMHWEQFKLKFDCILSGYLGSHFQADLMVEIFKNFSHENTIKVVDPVMADHGKLYSCMNNDFVKKMKRLCSFADVIIPNLTEACLLSDTNWHSEPFTSDEIQELLFKLKKLGSKNIIITGVSLEENSTGACCFNCSNNVISYYSCSKIQGDFHGTGDIFATVVAGSLLNGFDLYNATINAVDFVFDCITNTKKANRESKHGVIFERSLDKLLQLRIRN